MIAFACVVGDEEQFNRWAVAGIDTVREPDTVIAVRRDQTSIFSAYNEMLAELGARDDLEAVVLLHQDVEIVDADFMSKLRAAVARPRVAVVGVVGGREPTDRGGPWWQSQEVVGCFGWDWLMDPEREQLYDPGSFWVEYGRREGEVDGVDGCLIAMPAWAARELRFDEQLAPGFHGYDIDICLQALEAGHKVWVADIHVMHHNDAALPDAAEFEAAYKALRMKWAEPVG